MILILNILDNNNAKWHLLNDDQVKEHNFDMLVGEENILPELAQLVTKEAIDFSDLSDSGSHSLFLPAFRPSSLSLIPLLFFPFTKEKQEFEP